MTTKSLTPEEFEEFLRIGRHVVESEHKQMPRVCPRCGGKMIFKLQSLVKEPEPGDVLVYECDTCGEKVERFFAFPEEYARYFKRSQEEQH
ncbi:MAG: hypothetical protein QXW47_05590 [Candidatus Jordarchaeales archaeon]